VVAPSAKLVDTESAEVRGAVITGQMEQIPTDRQFLDLTPLEPGVQLLDGAVLAARAVGATAVHVCLDQTRTAQVQTVWSAVQERALAGLGDVPITVQQLPRRYVASEETALISWLNGGEAKPTVTPPRPFERGVRRLPTLVDNDANVAATASIVRGEFVGAERRIPVRDRTTIAYLSTGLPGG
jgi:NADH:ubiquinone oxidoreductase subunit F (NADH-binding)